MSGLAVPTTSDLRKYLNEESRKNPPNPLLANYTSTQLAINPVPGQAVSQQQTVYQQPYTYSSKGSTNEPLTFNDLIMLATFYLTNQTAVKGIMDLQVIRPKIALIYNESGIDKTKYPVVTQFIKETEPLQQIQDLTKEQFFQVIYAFLIDPNYKSTQDNKFYKLWYDVVAMDNAVPATASGLKFTKGDWAKLKSGTNTLGEYGNTLSESIKGIYTWAKNHPFQAAAALTTVAGIILYSYNPQLANSYLESINPWGSGEVPAVPAPGTPVAPPTASTTPVEPQSWYGRATSWLWGSKPVSPTEGSSQYTSSFDPKTIAGNDQAYSDFLLNTQKLTPAEALAALQKPLALREADINSFLESELKNVQPHVEVEPPAVQNPLLGKSPQLLQEATTLMQKPEDLQKYLTEIGVPSNRQEFFTGTASDDQKLAALADLLKNNPSVSILNPTIPTVPPASLPPGFTSARDILSNPLNTSTFLKRYSGYTQAQVDQLFAKPAEEQLRIVKDILAGLSGINAQGGIFEQALTMALAGIITTGVVTGSKAVYNYFTGPATTPDQKIVQQVSNPATVAITQDLKQNLGVTDSTKPPAVRDFVANGAVLGIMDKAKQDQLNKIFTNISAGYDLVPNGAYLFSALGLIGDSTVYTAPPISNSKVKKAEFDAAKNMITDSVGLMDNETFVKSIASLKPDTIALVLFELGFTADIQMDYNRQYNVSIPTRVMCSVDKWIEKLQIITNYKRNPAHETIISLYKRNPNSIGFKVLQAMVNLVNTDPLTLNKNRHFDNKGQSIPDLFRFKIEHAPVDRRFDVNEFANPYPKDHAQRIRRTQEIICGTEKIERAIRSDTHSLATTYRNILNNPTLRTPVNRKRLAMVCYGKYCSANSVYGGSTKRTEDVLKRVNGTYGSKLYKNLIDELIGYIESSHAQLTSKGDLYEDLQAYQKSEEKMVQNVCDLVERVAIMYQSKGLINVGTLSAAEVKELQQFYEKTDAESINEKKDLLKVNKGVNILARAIYELIKGDL